VFPFSVHLPLDYIHVFFRENNMLCFIISILRMLQMMLYNKFQRVCDPSLILLIFVKNKEVDLARHLNGMLSFINVISSILSLNIFINCNIFQSYIIV
jgi:hypothetical protein